MLDELATLGHLQTVENAVGLAAGYGIQLISIFQDVAQMRGLYKARWASFIGNAGIRALFNLDDFDTAEYWSKFIGRHVVEKRSRQEDKFGLSEGQNVGEDMHQLLPSDQLMMDFAAGNMLVLVQGARPIVTRRVAYFDDQGLAGAWDDPRRPATAAEPVSPGPSAAPRHRTTSTVPPVSGAAAARAAEPPPSPWGAPQSGASPFRPANGAAGPASAKTGEQYPRSDPGFRINIGNEEDSDPPATDPKPNSGYGRMSRYLDEIRRAIDNKDAQ